MEDADSIMAAFESSDEGTVRDILMSRSGLDVVTAHMPREMRALWISAKNMEVLHVVNETEAWYRGEPGAETPKTFLSAVTRPGEDAGENLAHRLYALGRTIAGRFGAKTRNWLLFKQSMLCALDRLEMLMLGSSAICEMRRQFEEFVAFVEKIDGRKWAAEVVRDLLEKRIRSLVEAADEVSKAFERLERSMLNGEPEDPFAREERRTLIRIETNTETLVRRAKRTPASAAAQKLVNEKWQWLKTHPYACKCDKKKERVFHRDLFDFLSPDDRKRCGIGSVEDVSRILDTARKNRLGK